jgi:nicotinamidase-related amidase
MQRLLPKQTVVVVVDIQERLAAAMPEAQLLQLVRATTVLIEAARLLGAPVLLTEQYTRGLGATLETLSGFAERASAKRFEKVHFSAFDAPGFPEALRASGAKDAVVVGMEAHVCVYQTVRDLVGAGIGVHVPIDGVCSRREDHRLGGLGLCERAGAVPTLAETVVFDWLGKSGTDEFRQLSKLVK